MTGRTVWALREPTLTSSSSWVYFPFVHSSMHRVVSTPHRETMNDPSSIKMYIFSLFRDLCHLSDLISRTGFDLLSGYLFTVFFLVICSFAMPRSISGIYNNTIQLCQLLVLFLLLVLPLRIPMQPVIPAQDALPDAVHASQRPHALDPLAPMQQLLPPAVHVHLDLVVH